VWSGTAPPHAPPPPPPGAPPPPPAGGGVVGQRTAPRPRPAAHLVAPAPHTGPRPHPPPPTSSPHWLMGPQWMNRPNLSVVNTCRPAVLGNTYGGAPAGTAPDPSAAATATATAAAASLLRVPILRGGSVCGGCECEQQCAHPPPPLGCSLGRRRASPCSAHTRLCWCARRAAPPPGLMRFAPPSPPPPSLYRPDRVRACSKCAQIRDRGTTSWALMQSLARMRATTT
jgi:hypothetical protein